MKWFFWDGQSVFAMMAKHHEDELDEYLAERIAIGEGDDGDGDDGNITFSFLFPHGLPLIP
jgi:hypothetical protein